MTLGILLSLGDSFKNMAKSGQDVRLKRFYLSVFAKEFEKVIIFSYENEKVSNLPYNIKIVPNKYNLHRFLYAIFLPFLNIDKIQQCDVFRVYPLFGTPPAIIARLFFSKPFVFNYAYDYKKVAEIENRPFHKFLIYILGPIAIIFAKKVFAANKLIFEKLPNGKAIYLPNGVDTNFFKPVKNKKKNKIPVILSVGRFEKQKNFETLVEAMRGINARLVIVGQGSLKEKLEKLAKENNVDLKIINKVENTKMPKIYSMADIFVLPSLIEGSPKVLIEAMSCGLPVIGSDVEGIDEILDGSNGQKCATSSKSIRQALIYLIKNPKTRSRMSKNARQFVIKNYNLEALLKKEIVIFKQLPI